MYGCLILYIAPKLGIEKAINKITENETIKILAIGIYINGFFIRRYAHPSKIKYQKNVSRPDKILPSTPTSTLSSSH